MRSSSAGFFIGQIVRHSLFDYRGAIIGIDPIFSSSNDWYEAVAQSRPPKDMPWYHVPRDETWEGACVAERNLEAGNLGQAIRHPDLRMTSRALPTASISPFTPAAKRPVRG